MGEDVAEVAKGLSEAQRRYLTTEAQFRKPRPYSEARWMTFPPSNTHKALQGLGLVKPWGSITDLGLAVRTYLQTASSDRASQ